jgi:pyruvate/2-oxoglutarate dehydrogenase complex dihydrolipoamide dehydrogenase (E3) component
MKPGVGECLLEALFGQRARDAAAPQLGVVPQRFGNRLVTHDIRYHHTPSQALLSAAKRAAALRDAGTFGVEPGDGHRVDFAKVMERMRRLRARIAPNDSAERFRNLGVDVFIGEGRFTGTDTIEAGGKTLKFSKAVIATGARAVDLPMP